MQQGGISIQRYAATSSRPLLAVQQRSDLCMAASDRSQLGQARQASTGSQATLLLQPHLGTYQPLSSSRASVTWLILLLVLR